MRGTIYNVQTGQADEVDLVAWVLPGGRVEMLNPGDPAPAGAEQATQEQVQAWLATQAAVRARQQQIEALLKPVGLTQAWQLDGFMGGALALALQQGMTEEQLIAANPAYATAHAIRQQILAILAAP